MEKAEERIQNEKEIGLREHDLWRQSALRGHRMIGQYIINRYRLTEEDFKPGKLKRHAIYNKRCRKRKKEEQNKWINKKEIN